FDRKYGAPRLASSTHGVNRRDADCITVRVPPKSKVRNGVSLCFPERLKTELLIQSLSSGPSANPDNQGGRTLDRGTNVHVAYGVEYRGDMKGTTTRSGRPRKPPHQGEIAPDYRAERIRDKLRQE